MRVGDMLHWDSFVEKFNDLIDWLEKRYAVPKVDREAELKR